MAVETRFVVTRDGKEIGVFATHQEAETFETMTERAERLAVVLTASAHEHQLDMEAVQAVARAMAGREKEMLAIFGGSAKAKGKAGRGRGPKMGKKAKSPVLTTEAETT